MFAAALGCGVASGQDRPASLEEADALLARAEKLIADRKLDEALSAARESLRIREAALPPRHPDIARSLNTVGFALFMQGDLNAAEPAFARSLDIRRSVGESPAIATALNNLASLYQAQGRLREAEPLLAEALRRQQRARAPAATLATAHNNLGGLHVDRGDYARAATHFAEAARLIESVEAPDENAVARVLNNLGLATQELRDFPRAQAHYERALTLREKQPHSVELARTLNNLASLHQEQGRLDDARPLYDRAVAIYEKLAPEHPGFGQVLSNLAVLHLLQREHDAAEPLYRRALAIREKALGSMHPDVATSLTAYAIFLFNTSRFDEAMNAVRRASDIIEQNLALVIEVGSEAQKERYIQMFADSVDITLWMRGATPETARPAADEIALATVLRRKGRIQDVLATATDALRTQLGSGAAAQIDELARARAALARVALRGGGPAAQRAATIAAQEERVRELEATLHARSAELRAGATSATADAVQRAIPEGAVLVEFFRYRPFDPYAAHIDRRFGPPRYVAAAIRAQGAAAWVELGDAQAIDAAIDAFRAALLNPERTDVADRARALRPLLTDKLLAVAGADSRLLLAPDGQLNVLPFQALVDSDGRYLLDRYRFTYLTSGRDLITRPPAAASAPLVIANPAFGPRAAGGGAVGRSFVPLPGAAGEARDVAARLPDAQLLTGASATERAVKAARSPLILHIATHGFFLAGSGPRPVAGVRGLRVAADESVTTLPPLLRSGLALAGANRRPTAGSEDGVLTAGEAALLDLRGTELVFLSACESGLGVINAGDSVYGLRRAFVIAGTRSQVLTLWQVSDRATREFVADVYARLAGGASRADALREAQRAALRDGRRAHPFFWAGFILSGADVPISLNRIQR